MDVKESGIKDESNAQQAAPNGAIGTEEQKAPGREIQGPTVGFDNEGYFFVKVHMTTPYLSMLGWLDECKEWLVSQNKFSMRKKIEEMKEKELVKPKGFRGFNLFNK